MYPCLVNLPIEILEKVRLQDKMDSDRTLSNAFGERNLTDHFFKWLFHRISIRANFFLDIYGLPNSGKTYVGLFVCGKIYPYPKFSNKNIFFGSREIMNQIHTAESNSIILNDDKTKDFGKGSNRRAAEYQNLIQVVRKYQLSLVNTATQPRLWNQANYLLEALYTDRNRRITRLALQTCERDTGLRTIGFVEIPHPDTILPADEITLYESRKDKFIEETMRKTNIDDADTDARKVIAMPDFITVEQAYFKKGKQKAIPSKLLFQLVSSAFTFLNANNEVENIAERVLLICIRERGWKV